MNMPNLASERISAASQVMGLDRDVAFQLTSAGLCVRDLGQLCLNF
jgi:hypothetical protein